MQLGELEQMLEYKLKFAGLPKLREVMAAGTSQTCPACGHRAKENRPERDLFKCVKCEHQARETLLDQDIASIRDGGTIQDLIDRLRSQVGRLEISPEELSGRNQRSALFKTMFLAFRSAGAKDWHSNLTIALDHSGVQHRLQFHHIFPKAVLTKAGVAPREADDISNLAFIGGKTNRVISDKPPKEYLAFFAAKSGEEGFSVQEIPLD